MESNCRRGWRSPYFAVSWKKVNLTAYGCSDCHDDSGWIIDYSTCWRQEHLDYNGDYLSNGTYPYFY